MEEDEPIEHTMITRAIENAQRKVEGHNFDIRKHLLEYDDVMNKQREVIYRQRREVLGSEDIHEVVTDMFVLMILAPILAQLIYYAISRKREYLADASSALYTRYPEGLASALEKLGASTCQLKSANQATAPMYTVNPFHKEGMKASDLTSTHPPISERIRILRAMAGGASFVDYESAYRKMHPGQGILSKATVGAVGAVGIRQASASVPGEMALAEKTARNREVSDLMLRLNQYRTVDCECGARWKIPPGFKDDSVLCTRCGRRIKL